LDCHIGEFAAASMDLSEGLAYANLVGVASGFGPTVPRVKPGDPDNSFLMWRLNNKDTVGYMPPSDAADPGPIPPDQVALVKAWIAGLTPESN